MRGLTRRLRGQALAPRPHPAIRLFPPPGGCPARRPRDDIESGGEGLPVLNNRTAPPPGFMPELVSPRAETPRRSGEVVAGMRSGRSRSGTPAERRRPVGRGSRSRLSPIGATGDEHQDRDDRPVSASAARAPEQPHRLPRQENRAVQEHDREDRKGHPHPVARLWHDKVAHHDVEHDEQAGQHAAVYPVRHWKRKLPLQ
jgi:hypothetical protein